jgi:hypothetical protein
VFSNYGEYFGNRLAILFGVRVNGLFQQSSN